MRQPRWMTRLALRPTTAALVLASLPMSIALATQSAQAQTFHLLHVFNYTDGGQPFAALVRDSAGNLYGTTSDGGTYGDGTVFKLDKTHKLTVLHNFTSDPDGRGPEASLLRDAAGNLYGTTLEG